MNDMLPTYLQRIAQAMFQKNFFGIFHGSLSAKADGERFLINKKDALFNNLDAESLIMLYYKQDYRWNDASLDSFIHSILYQNFPNTRFIAYGLPPFTCSYALKYDKIIPKDYYGARFIGEIEVHDPRDFDTWHERADTEINRYFKEHKSKVMVIRGYGVYVRERNPYSLAKLMALVENSCKILYFSQLLGNTKGEEDLFDL